jgi:tetratricopeptide (TPR) repeat protein
VSAHFDRLKAALADRYIIEREIGRGGMATVYVAEDLKLHRPVALKVLRPELAAALGPERFLREIKIAANLNHPHILPLHDSGETDGFLFYVMPYVEGESLRDRLNREKQLPIDDALKIAGEVADALGFAHEHNVVHRDIKPENILLVANHAAVTDFGVARAIEEAGETRLTETGIAIGTPAYLSPEQASGERQLDGRSDIYALGCVLYEMLAGEPPFTGPTAENIVQKHLTVEPLAVNSGRPTVSNDVVATVSKALAKAPADRHQTAAALGEAIAAAQVSLVTPSGGVTSTDTPPTRTAVIGPSKLRVGVAVAATVIALIATAVLLTRWIGERLDPNRVLVVEFEDESGREEAETLGSMAQKYIIQILTDAGFANAVDPMTTLAVSQNVAAEGMATGPENVLALADEAQAGTVVSGNYYAEGDSLYVQTRIADANDGSLLETVGPVGGVIGARSELVGRLGQEVVVALASLLGQDIGSWEPTVQPATYEAYEAYSQGLEAYFRNDWLEAGTLFERAVAADPTFHRARLWGAQSYTLLGYYCGRRDLASYATAESLIAPLVERPEQLSRYERCRLNFVKALGPQGGLLASYEAARCMAQAAPGSDDARREQALFTIVSNRPREGIELLRELDPDRGIMKQWWEYWVRLAGAYHMLGDYEGELEVSRQGRERFPERPFLLVLQARVFAALDRRDEVAATLDTMRSLDLQETRSGWFSLVADELRAHDHRDAAQEVLRELIKWSRSRPIDTEQQKADLAGWLYQAEQWDDAQEVYEELAEGHPENTEYLAALGRLAARNGNHDEASRISEVLRSSRDPWQERVHTRLRARIAALVGDQMVSITLLRQYFEGCTGYGVWPHGDIDFESLRDYPPFQELMRPKG